MSTGFETRYTLYPPQCRGRARVYQDEARARRAAERMPITPCPIHGLTPAWCGDITVTRGCRVNGNRTIGRVTPYGWRYED